MRKAYTLVEVLFALILLSVLLLIVEMTLSAHLRLLDYSRTEVEEGRLARAILEKIARDIRSVVLAKPTESVSADTSFLSAPISTDPTAELVEGEESTTSEELPVMPESGEVYGKKPGIYGTTDWIQIDTGRLPRGETYRTEWILGEGNALGDRVSPVKTSLYFMGKDTGTLNVEDSASSRTVDSLGQTLGGEYGVQYGLFRRLLDRGIAEYMEDEGLEYQYEPYDEPLAPEVEGIEFSYFDYEYGEWIDYWDMDEMGYLPAAVRVIVHIRSNKRTQRAIFLGAFQQSMPEIQIVTYSTVIPMPLAYVAPPIAEEEEQTTAE
ncbi:MAG: prepilin-type N-terminal cleavage/methylation domain-containing protein [Thermoguttaceae bacterium]